MKRFFKAKTLIIVALVLASLFFLKNRNDLTLIDKAKAVPTDSAQHQASNYRYGFLIDNFQLEEFKVERHQTLSTILNKYEVSAKEIHQIIQNSKKIFDLRKIKAGHKYTILFTKSSLKKAKYFVYENTPKQYIVFSLTGTLDVSMGQKEVTKVRKIVNGTIESSLWKAMVDAHADPLISIELSDIYASSLDFFELRKGDEFNVIYDEQMIDGEPIQHIDVVAANFIHREANNYAFAFKDGKKIGYFDEEGKSIKKSFLKAPLHYTRVSSKFSNNRFHPVLKRYRPHHGVDYAAPTGTPVLSIGDGVVIKKGYQRRGGGRYLKVKHNSIYTTTYMHFSRFRKNIGVGSRVEQGQVIGYVGASGLATGPHLDFRVYKNGRAINPLTMKSPSAAPISKQNVAAYNRIKDQLLSEYSLCNKRCLHEDV